MAIALVQAPAGAIGNSVTSLSVTYVSPPTVGNMLLVWALANTAVAPISVTVSNAADPIVTAIPWSKAGASINSGALYYVLPTGGGASYTWTVSFSANRAIGLLAAEYRGVAFLDTVSAWNYSAATTSFSSPTLSPAGGGELAVACFNSNSSGPGTFTWGGGFATEGNVQVSTQVAGNWGDQLLASAANVQASATTTNTINGMIAQALFAPPVFTPGKPFKIYPPPA